MKRNIYILIQSLKQKWEQSIILVKFCYLRFVHTFSSSVNRTKELVFCWYIE